MFTTVQKWGNSHAIRIPKVLLEMAQLKENDQVEIQVQNGNLAIIPVRKHRTLEERIAEYSGDYKCAEWDTGETQGKEVL
jgi:antitoxin MazE